MGEYLLGIDTGATVAKVAIFDLEGRMLRRAAHTTAASHPHSGWTERDMLQLWQQTARAIRTVLDEGRIAPAEIVAVGACGHGNGLYLLDREGEPLRAGILSMDTRAVEVVAAWRERGVLEAVWPAILQVPYAGQPPALLRWLKLREPEAYARVGAVLLAKDYIAYRLSGGMSADLSDSGAAGLIDLRTRAYARELLEAFGIAEVAGSLPPLLEGTALVGGVGPDAARATGLLAGTPVVAGLFDVNAGALGAGIILPGQGGVTAGTWSVNFVVGDAPVARRGPLFSVAALGEHWLTVDASPSGAANLEWFVAQCCAEEQAEAAARGISAYAVCDERVAELPPVASSIIYHPFLYGANEQASARAGFYGVAGWHTRAHLLRALYEGVAYGSRAQVERLAAAGQTIGSLRLLGGGARSRVWAQLFADVLNRQLEVPAGSELGARGAALCAGIGAGVYRDERDAVARAVAVERTHLPDEVAAARYEEGYARFRQLVAVLREPWEGLQRLERAG
jgi:L-xylulokinase